MLQCVFSGVDHGCIGKMKKVACLSSLTKNFGTFFLSQSGNAPENVQDSPLFWSKKKTN